VSVLKQAFDLFDADGSEEIEEQELKDAMKALGLNPGEQEVIDMTNEVARFERVRVQAVNLDIFITHRQGRI